MPPESCQGYLSPKPASPTCASSASTRSRNSVLRLAPILLPERRHDLQRQHHVVADRQPRQQRRVLERHADAHRLGADLAARDIDIAARRCDQPGHQLEDGRLAAAGRADQRDEIALADAQIGRVERAAPACRRGHSERRHSQARRKPRRRAQRLPAAHAASAAVALESERG